MAQPWAKISTCRWTARPVHWSEIAPAGDDPALPDGVRALADIVRAPSELTRRLRQIGLVEEGQGQACKSALKVGQCLVSPKGALWRWDGYRASADAPRPQRSVWPEEQAGRAGSRGRRSARQGGRGGSHARKGRSRDQTRRARPTVRHARTCARHRAPWVRPARRWPEAEKAAGDLVSRRTALEEARSGLLEARDEAATAVRSAEEGADQRTRPAAPQEELDR